MRRHSVISVPPAPTAPDNTRLAETTVADATGRKSAAHDEHTQSGRASAVDDRRSERGGGA